MIDLTRALHLGFVHGHAQLAPWRALTTGRPAVLGEHPGTPELARSLADLIGLPRATFAPSTLHLVTDLYGALPGHVATIHIHPCSYAITRWGLERARLRGVPIRPFRTVRELACGLAPRSLIVCDAICLTCRQIAPLAALQQLAARSRGWLLVDDSQGIGLLGDRPTRAMPYGRGGTGTLRWCGARRERVIAIGSCAKAFGAPLAFLAGDDDTVAWFEAIPGTRMHASPCNAAELAAIAAALRDNRDGGDELRARLLARVRTFRRGVALRGGMLERGTFPVHVTTPLPTTAACAIESRLAARGVRALRLRGAPGTSRLGFALTAAHDREAVDEAAAIVGDELARRRC